MIEQIHGGAPVLPLEAIDAGAGDDGNPGDTQSVGDDGSVERFGENAIARGDGSKNFFDGPARIDVADTRFFANALPATVGGDSVTDVGDEATALTLSGCGEDLRNEKAAVCDGFVSWEHELLG